MKKFLIIATIMISPLIVIAIYGIPQSASVSDELGLAMAASCKFGYMEAQMKYSDASKETANEEGAKYCFGFMGSLGN